MKTSTCFLAFASLLLFACSGSSSSDVLAPPGESDPNGKPGTSTSTTPTDPAPTGEQTKPNQPSDPKKDDPTTTTAGPPATAADCDAFAAKFCPKASACNHLVSKLVGSDCEDRIAGICKAHLSAPGTGFTQTVLAACGTAYTTMTCAQAFGDVQPAACNFKGSLALNSPCAFDDQCSSGSCAGNDDNKCGSCASKPTTTTSTPKASLGEACDNSGKTAPQCNFAFGLWCGSATNTCIDIPLEAIGQPCGYIGEDLYMCEAGATCKYGSNGTGSCVAQKAIGASCTAASGYEECVFGTSCISGKCAYPTAAAICK